MTTEAVMATAPLSTPWQTLDPFLFCVHHDDAYPAGDGRLGLDPSQLGGRSLGSDFSHRDGFSMYHGDHVPGFPRHPHRGFETITLARRGYIDHSDSLGAAARFGQGDVQWMTAGAGIVHSEMFPMLERERGNPTELFQIWLNLPGEDKLADPHFSMLWSETLPRVRPRHAAGVELVVVAGSVDGVAAPAPPPASWAARPEAAVAVWTLSLAPGARWQLPAAAAGLNRVLYVFAGDGVRIDGRHVDRGHAVQLRSDAVPEVENGALPAEALLLQGRPIDEPVARHGPFVMNTTEEIRQAMRDFQATGFGGWPWNGDGPVHGGDEGRFARRPDGSLERPSNA
jgi:redox-sensitive bicupin YhaK (pirin superfamily)